MDDRDAVVNRLCSVLVPLLFAYVVLLCIIGGKLANQLLKRDTYDKKHIKLRPYGIVQTCIVEGLVAFIIGYFSWNKTWDMVVIFAVIMAGYSWIKLGTYSVRLEYTNSRMKLYYHKEKLVIPFENVSQMCWETHRGSITYKLTIYCYSGEKVIIPSGDFIGLNKLKAAFDSRNQK